MKTIEADAEREGWIAFSDRLPDIKDNGRGDTAFQKVLVTNNIDARDAFGEPSHVWFGSPVEAPDVGNGLDARQWCIYGDSGGRCASYLTHWMDPFAARAQSPVADAQARRAAPYTINADTVKQVAQGYGNRYEDRIVFYDDKFTDFCEALEILYADPVVAQATGPAPLPEKTRQAMGANIVAQAEAKLNDDALDAAAFRALRDLMTWDVVEHNSARARWSVAFTCGYGLTETEDDLRQAVESYANEGEDEEENEGEDEEENEALCAVPVVAQAETKVSDDARECLLDVVSHHGDFTKACRVIRDLRAAGDEDSAAYWRKQIDVLDRMKGQAERALAAPSDAGDSARPTPEQITHHASLIANSWLGQASETEVEDVATRIREMLDQKADEAIKGGRT